MAHEVPPKRSGLAGFDAYQLANLGEPAVRLGFALLRNPAGSLDGPSPSSLSPLTARLARRAGRWPARTQLLLGSRLYDGVLALTRGRVQAERSGRESDRGGPEGFALGGPWPPPKLDQLVRAAESVIRNIGEGRRAGTASPPPAPPRALCQGSAA
jgi:hypothetical protein